MNQLLHVGQSLSIPASGENWKVEQFLGGGGQGEVYRATFDGRAVAIKWYFPHYLQSDPRQRERLELACKAGPPSDRFLWPVELVDVPDAARGFGYLMPLREARFKGIVDLMKRRTDPSFRALVTAGFELAHNYLQLHARGMCYRDISFGNVFFDPDNGEIRICDNDNVDVNGMPGAIGGTPRFMAPELVRGEASPSTDTDLHSLAVLLFYMLMVHHPLEGQRELAIKCLDLPAMARLYGTDPRFIFDPEDDSNRPVPGYHDNALEFWPVYPTSLRELFTRAFTTGLQDPRNGRVRESEWRSALVRLRDSITYCPHCGVEIFIEARASNGRVPPEVICWSCHGPSTLPLRLRLGNSIVVLNSDTRLYPHHMSPGSLYDFSRPHAQVARSPHHAILWGLRNLSERTWIARVPSGAVREVAPGRSVTLAAGTEVDFGDALGEILS